MPTPDHKIVFEQSSLEAAKWIGLLAMTVDHYGKIVQPELFTETHAVGRLAFPLFAGILGVRLGTAPELAGQYLRRLILWGAVSQPVFVLAGRPWHDGNILFTLALGVVALGAIQGVVQTDVERLPTRAWWALGAVPLAFCTEFGPAGVFMPAATALLTRRGVRTALLAFGPLGLLSNLVLTSPPLTPIDGWALLATPIALASPRLSRALPRLPGIAFYAYYPAHLLMLHWLDLAR